MKKFLFIIALVCGIAYNYDIIKYINPTYYIAVAVNKTLSLSGINSSTDHDKVDNP